MSYAIIRIQKFQQQAVVGIQIHDLRTKEVSRTNPDIDRSRTGENYALATPQGSYRETVQAHINALNLTRVIRKDAVVMCQALVTSDKSFFDKLTPEQEAAFFRDSLNFIKERYGEGNVVSAVIHKDEKTPHMHVNFMPIRDGKLSAKSIFTKQELTELQTDFVGHVGNAYSLQRGVQRNVKRRHLSTEAYKKVTALQEKRDFITAQDVSPKTLKKGLFSSIVETPQHIANRLNSEILSPILSELRDYRLERSAFKSKLDYYKKLDTKFKELTAGLSQEQISKLRQVAKDLLQERYETDKNKLVQKSQGVRR